MSASVADIGVSSSGVSVGDNRDSATQNGDASTQHTPGPDPSPSDPVDLRPSTPPLTQSRASGPLRTPEPPSRAQDTRLQVPRTPSSGGSGDSAASLNPASVYLSSPIRRSKHASWLTAGTMTPGRPSLKHSTSSASSAIASSPFRASSRPSGSGGRPVNLGTAQSIASLPLQTLLMTAEQAREIKDLDTARDTLVLAIEQGEQFRKAAQQFRSLANHHAFQHKLVQIERDESEQRFEVEANIQKKEIEKLVVDIMGYNDKSIDTEQIRRRLKRTKQRLKEMEELVASKDRQLAELQSVLAQYSRMQSMPLASMSMVQAAMQSGVHPTLLPPQSQHQAPQPASSSGSTGVPPAPQPILSPGSVSASSSMSSGSPAKIRPPPINTQVSTASSPASSNAEPLSALEVLASQVLSSGIQHPDGKHASDASNGYSDRSQGASTAPAVPAHYGSSPYSSPFYAPFSPYAAVPPHYVRQPPSSVPQFGSPEKRRRPSSSSTISAMSEEDTLEDINNE